MPRINRRRFLQAMATAGALEVVRAGDWARMAAAQIPQRSPQPGHIRNEYTAFLEGEQEALQQVPEVLTFSDREVTARIKENHRQLAVNDVIDGWRLLAICGVDGEPVAVFEKNVTHRGTIAYVARDRGVIAVIPKYVGSLSAIRPREITTSGPKLVRPATYTPGPDAAGKFLLESDEDPCYENVAGLGAEYIGWTLVSNEASGPEGSLFLDAQGVSREIRHYDDAVWAMDQAGRTFDPHDHLPEDDPQLFEYVHGYSKRTLLGGYLPVADVGVWNPTYQGGYECMVLLPQAEGAKPLGRVRAVLGANEKEMGGDNYVDCTAGEFFTALLAIWNHWHDFYESAMAVEVPDEWLVNAARAGITLARCSYRGLRPTYQIGEGAYTMIPERSHALFPVAHYEFVWAQQMWGLSGEVEPYFQYYLDHYILADGNFLYNTQDQVEAPLNAGIFLRNAARSYDYTGDAAAFERKLPTLERMLEFVLARYEDGKRRFPLEDRRYGLIWGSPEADFGDPRNDSPDSHPYYYQNAVWTWRGLVEHARVLARVADASAEPKYAERAKRYEAIAQEMRGLIERSLKATIAASTPERRAAGITPFHPFDTKEDPRHLTSYENHRFMMDFFTADWGDASMDRGHLKHREMAGMQILGLATDGALARTSNFMEHGTLAVKIRQPEYRSYLLTLYGLACFTSDNGCFYSPEDADLPGGHPLEGNRFMWSSVVNSVLQPTMGLRWLLCYEESDKDICHLQKGAPKSWFAMGQKIRVRRCPTRFGVLSWMSEAVSENTWKVRIETSGHLQADIVLHLHPPDGRALRQSSAGRVENSFVTIPKEQLAQKVLELQIST